MKILIIDDEKSQLNILSDILCDAGYEIYKADSGEKALQIISNTNFPVILTDLKMPGKDGIDVLKEALRIDPDTQVILMTAFGSIPSAVNAIKNGAYDYLAKPFQKEELLKVISHASEKARLLIENRKLREEFSTRYNYHNIIGNSKQMQEIYQLIERIKNIDSTVIITGESGTGKEVVARAIHFSGKRKEELFIPVNCGAIPENLIESELFGHERGSFTGASRTHIGKFEQAQRGTIFLDEIGAMPQNLQVRLLRVLQEKKIIRVGSNKSIELDVRIIAATNENLAQKVDIQEFRNDLFHRLNVFNINIPPLRNRQNDIPLLAKHFIQRYCHQYNKPVPALSPESMKLLEEHDFPGNVRELENIIEKTIILSDKDVIESHDLMFYEKSKLSNENNSTSLPEKELDMIITALSENRGSIKQASTVLGISYKTLQYRMKKFGLNKAEFKN